VYRAPATGTRSRGIVHRQSLWLAGTARHAPAAKHQLKMASTFKRLVIWRVLLFFGTRSLVKGYS